jgi:hypothetical protein
VIRQSLPIVEIATLYLETIPERLEISLLGKDGSNNVQQVFTTYNIQEEPHGTSASSKETPIMEISGVLPQTPAAPGEMVMPDLVQDIVLRSQVANSTMSGGTTKASISNFIREIPADLVDETVVQSTIEDLEKSRI